MIRKKEYVGDAVVVNSAQQCIMMKKTVHGKTIAIYHTMHHLIQNTTQHDTQHNKA